MKFYEKIINNKYTTYKFLGVKISINTAKKEAKSLFNKILKISKKPSDLPKASGILRNNQYRGIKILSDIKQLCNNSDIKYWIDFGTLLGAVRHKGFIPWDSDIDICVLRDDFLKLIPLLKDFYKETNIVVREFGYTNSFQLRLYYKDNDEFGVDIFPMDSYYKTNITQEEVVSISAKIKNATDILRKKCKKDSSFATNILEVRKFIKDIQNEIILERHNCNVNEPALFYGIDFPIPYKNLIKNYDLIFPLKTILFEGDEYSCPNDVVANLKYHYGSNFMQYPTKFKSSGDKLKEYIEGIQKNEVFVKW